MSDSDGTDRQPNQSDQSPEPRPLFASARERRLWLWALVVVVVIYATLGLARQWAGLLRAQGLLATALWFCWFLMATAFVLQAWRLRLRGAEIGVAIGIAGAYLLAFLRMTVPEERTHLFEYTVVALFIHEALLERRSQGRRVPHPALLAILTTSMIGAIDEGIQFLLPNRVFDPIDILFNSLAAVMAVLGSVALRWVGRWRR